MKGLESHYEIYGQKDVMAKEFSHFMRIPGIHRRALIRSVTDPHLQFRNLQVGENLGNWSGYSLGDCSRDDGTRMGTVERSCCIYIGVGFEAEGEKIRF